MSWVAVGVGGAALVGGIYSSNRQGAAADRAAQGQQGAALAGIDEQRRQFDLVQSLLSPYVQSGARALNGQNDIAGINGNDAQQKAIEALQASPMYQSQLKAGTNSILANASATGGLRGGNTQGALAQFSPALLSSTINDQFGRLGGLTTLGQNSAVMTGNAGMQTGNNVSNLLGQFGAAGAGGALAGGRADAGYASAIGQGFGAFGALYRPSGSSGYVANTTAPAYNFGGNGAPF